MAADPLAEALGAGSDMGDDMSDDMGDDMGEDMGEDMQAAKMTAATDMIGAMKADDPQSLIDAYKRLRDACESDYDA